MTKARDTANIVGGGFSGTIAGATMEPTGDTAAGDNAAMGFTAAEGLILTGDGSTGDVTIKNNADALVAHVPTGTTGVNFAGTPTFPDGSIAIADLDIDGGTDIGAALVDADLMIVDDGAGGTNRKATMSRLATYMGGKITGGSMVFIASSGAISDDATADFIQFDSSAYDSYVFHFIDVLPATDDVEMRALTSSDTSSHSYDTGAADYTVALAAATTDAYGQLYKAYGIGSAANEGFNGKVSVLNPHTSNHTKISVDGGTAFLASGAGFNAGAYNHNGFVRKEAAQVNAIRFYFESGNIASGEIVMYGIANGS